MKKNWTDEQIINYFNKHTNDKNGFVARNDENEPDAYLSKECDGFVYALLIEEDSNNMSYKKIQ